MALAEPPFSDVISSSGESWMWLLGVVIMTWFAGRGGHEITHSLLTRFRLLVPAWRFFDRPSPLIHLRARYQTASEQWTAWESALKPEPWHPLRLIYAPESSHRLALDGVVATLAAASQRLATRPSMTRADARCLAAYQQIDILVQQWAKTHDPQACAVEFRLECHSLENHQIAIESILIAPPHAFAMQATGDVSA